MKTPFVKKIILFAVITMMQIITQFIYILPWWSFIIPLLFICVFINVKKMKVHTFLIGFLCGFLIWSCGNFYLGVVKDNILIYKIAQLMALSKVTIVLISGLIGGVLSGLSIYTGDKIFSSK
jgi:hypothetical protein